MIKYIVKRLLLLIPVLIGITFLSFAMMRVAGGDAVTYMYENAGSAVSQEVIDETRKEYGLDQPFLVQYAKWFTGIATGDMGISYVSKRDVYDTFVEKLPATILLTISSVLLTMLISIPLGILSAVKHNRWIDYLIRFFSFIGNSMPNFFAALVLMYFLSIRLGWFPVITTDNTALSLVLPTLTLAISMASKYTRQVRATILEELNKDYVKGARARGVRGSVIIWKNVMEIFHAYDHYTSCAFHRKPFGRNHDRRDYFYVGRCGKDGSRCHYYERLSDHSGVCCMDGDYLRYCESYYGYHLSLSGSPRQIRG